MSIKPRILLWDIETGYNLVTTFGLQVNGYIPYSAIQAERYVICASFKELGKPKITSFSIDNDPLFERYPTNDYTVLESISQHIDGADALIAHNGDNFDIKFINSRLVYHNLPPLPPVIQVDTLKMAKQKFRFNSNRLDYLGKYLGVGKKIKTTESLWLGCLQGDAAAVHKMVKYNQQDVVLLEKVYNKLAPFCSTKLNRAAFNKGMVCPSCGSKHLHSRGFRYTVTSRYPRYQCTNCGHWSAGTSIPKEEKTLVK